MILAILIQGIIGVAIANPPSQTDTRAVNEKAGGDDAAPQPTLWIVPTKQREPYSADYQRACNKPESSEEADLCQQWRVAEAAEYTANLVWLQTIIGVIGLGLLFLTLGATAWAAWASAKAARASHEQVALSRETFIADQRPWVAVTLKLVGPIEWKQDGCYLHFEIVLKNTGNSPAFNIYINIKSCHAFAVNYDIEQQKLADETVSQTKERMAWNYGMTLFPNHVTHQQWSVVIQKTDIEAMKTFWNEMGFSDEEAIFPAVVGSVQYRSVFDDIPHQTGFIAKIRRHITDSDTFAIGPSVGDIPLGHLTLERWISDGRTD